MEDLCFSYWFITYSGLMPHELKAMDLELPALGWID